MVVQGHGVFLRFKLNKATSSGDIETINKLSEKIKHHLGGHINHSLYWKMLAPPKKGGGKLPGKNSKLMKEIEASYGSADNLMNHFIFEAQQVQGTGWVWLNYDLQSHKLRIDKTRDQENVLLQENLAPLLTIDAWEHAWYPTYKNEKPKYFKEIWKIVNWDYVEKRFNNPSKKVEI